MSPGNKSAVTEGLVVYPEWAAPSYLSSAKVAIDRSADCASVSPPVQPPSPLPPFSSLHPPSPRPKASLISRALAPAR
ncbi:hypothetical protein PBY51_008870 [Eleginops maclovinus]|uniref:Uncharacterized protein n=1 Tax=Eleginops maclovinus TaxID=56733 RepID=A0AAN7WHA6_ELEMC|nr:hypothetical protein PBY51_008870 [Eleginops maclovinus]